MPLKSAPTSAFEARSYFWSPPPDGYSVSGAAMACPAMMMNDSKHYNLLPHRIRLVSMERHEMSHKTLARIGICVILIGAFAGSEALSAARAADTSPKTVIWD